MARKMTVQERRAFLSEGTRTAKLATIMLDGAPHVMPVWFVLDGDDVLFNTGRDSVKGRNVRRDPRVSLVVDEDRSSGWAKPPAVRAAESHARPFTGGVPAGMDGAGT